MKKILCLCIFSVSLCIQNIHADNTLLKSSISGYSYEIIEFDTSSTEYELKIGMDTQGGSSLRTIMESVGGVSGVTGVFQCPKDYPSCGGRNFTINERYINGEKIGTYDTTGQRVVLGWKENYEAFIFQSGEINKNREAEIHEGLANHPLLLLDGVPMTESYWKKGLIDFKMIRKGTRNFICASKGSKKIYFGLVYAIDIDTLPIILKRIGCYNAINLDAGYSTAMIHNGGYLRGPGRDILDGVFIVPKKIDLVSIKNNANHFSTKLKNILKKYPLSSRIYAIEKIEYRIEEILTQLHENASEDILEKNFIGEYDPVGEKISFSKHETERIYLLELIKRHLGEQRNSYQAEALESLKS